MIAYHEGEHLANFERYAQVLSQNFDVRIYLDGTKAETHADKSIHLPNIKNMSPMEIDCLYGILLHEIGHVKYSRLNGNDFKKMKGAAHFHIWNAIEDARIENKLISRLEGANNIFEKLYGEQFAALGEKIFGVKFDASVNEWHLFSVHVHDYLLKTKKQHFNVDLYPEEVKNKVLELFNRAKPTIDAHKLTTADHAFSLSTKLFKQFGPKSDDSGLGKLIRDLFGNQNSLQEMHEKIKNDPRLIELKAQKKELNSKKRALKAKVEKIEKSKKVQEANAVYEQTREAELYLVQLNELNEQKAKAEAIRQQLKENESKTKQIKDSVKTENS